MLTQWLARVKASLPSRKTVLSLAFAGAFGAGLATSVSSCVPSRIHPNPNPNPTPAPTTDWNAVGKAYLPALGSAYASAWEQGAAGLEAGQGIDVSLGVVASQWASGRTKLFGELVAPEFEKVIPEGTADADISPVQRAALAEAWRAFAASLKP
jgi:hypothetical protein